jgi:hypothetical protein
MRWRSIVLGITALPNRYRSVLRSRWYAAFLDLESQSQLKQPDLVSVSSVANGVAIRLDWTVEHNRIQAIASSSRTNKIKGIEEHRSETKVTTRSIFYTRKNGSVYG